MNILNTEVSYYPGSVKNNEGQVVNLFEYLTQPSAERIAKVTALRGCPDPDQQKELKKKVGCITPSGVFHPTRKAEHLVKHSGFIALDFDSDANEGVDFAAVKRQVSRLTWVAACMYSIRGKGLVMYVPIKHPDKHRQHFERLAEDFARLGLTVDKACVDVSRARFDTFDPEPYVNTAAEVYGKLSAQAPAPKPQKLTPPTYVQGNTGDPPGDVFRWACSRVESKGVFFAQGSRHAYILRLCRILNKYGVSRGDAEAWVDKHLMPLHEVESNCISDPYTKFTSEHGARQYTTTRTPTPSHRSRYTVLKPVKYVTTPNLKWSRVEPGPAETVESPDRFEAIAHPPALDPTPPQALQVWVPGEPLRLSPHEVIIDPAKFESAHTALIAAYPGKAIAQPYIERLERFRAMCGANFEVINNTPKTEK